MVEFLIPIDLFPGVHGETVISLLPGLMATKEFVQILAAGIFSFYVG